LAALSTDLRHVLPVATDLLTALAADLSHVFAIAAHSHSTLSGCFGTATLPTIRAFSAFLRCHRYLQLLKFTGYFLTVFLKLTVRQNRVCRTHYTIGDFSSPVAFIALALLRFGFRMLADVTAKRFPNVIAFLEFSLFVSPHKSLVSSCINEFSFVTAVLSRHKTPPCFPVDSGISNITAWPTARCNPGDKKTREQMPLGSCH
jgi:hypothetical protein